MTMRRLVIVFLVSLVAVSAAAIAGPLTYELPNETADLKPGPGVETAILCRACHSADYISTQPASRGRAFWEAEVQKMIKVYKAPINPADAAAIVDYLAATY
jgi:sulfite dehydrogenase (cytochrome) subunit B